MQLFDKQKIHIPVGWFLSRAPSVSDKNWVLLVCDDALGDLLMMTGVIRYLNECGYQVGLVLRDTWQELAPLLGAAQVFPVNLAQYRHSLSYRINFLNQIRQINYAWAAGSILVSNVNADILKYSAAAKRYACLRAKNWDSYRRVWWADQKIEVRPTVSKDGIYTDILELLAYYYGQILKQSITAQQIAPAVSMSNMPTQPLESLAQVGAYVHYISDTAGKKRQYPVEKLLPGLVEYAKKHQVKIVVTARNTNPNIIADKHIINLTGKTSLIQVCQIIFHARAVVGNETGATHLAWLLHKPTVMIYGGGHFGLFRPGKNCRTVYKKRPCFGCSWEECPHEGYPVPCIGEIPAEDILSALEQIMPK